MKHCRRILALVFFLGLNWLFLDIAGRAQHCVGWMAHLQLLPALLALNWVVIVFLALLTALIGRAYCSIICPLGVMQDVISWIAARVQPDKTKRRFGRFHYRNSKGLRVFRVVIFALFVACLLAGIGTFVQLLAPYSSWGRMVTMLMRPFVEMCNNLLASRSEAAGTFDYYQVDIWMRSLPVTIIAAVTFLIVAVMAWMDGRFYCNNICPVGTFLGFLSRTSVWGVRIDADRCKSCRLCERACKGSAIFIPTKEQRAQGLKPHVDLDRCVDCFDCLDKCGHDALHFGRSLSAKSVTSVKEESVDSLVQTSAQNATVSTSDSSAEGPTRRAFLAATATVLASAALKAEEKTTDGGIKELVGKERPVRQQPICPPGAVSLRHLQQHCTGCQLCVSACPNGVLRPSSDLMHLMMPESSYERGWCRPECTRCSDACPAGALIRFEGDDRARRAVKSSTKIGTTRWIKDNCIVNTDGVSCGLCSRRCPSGAINMVPSDPADDKSPKIPAIDEERCIGCGACENLCPSRPFSAIYVEGIEQHREI